MTSRRPYSVRRIERALEEVQPAALVANPYGSPGEEAVKKERPRVKGAAGKTNDARKYRRA